ncbi:MAG: metal-dependent transcriptional regulator [Candidatus Omnitrophica bacterium]|nr:metal-dependent transcriptional regulator [Candidatus Omnitrophota bacterium]MDD5042449.1 metal-dependent transcriptional regulator [Candidatus Omnitrophota bacterium]MDD5501160.1 metal-dependent transcriptional regulator [Candidatus Omnitrophota bacterium]
MKKVSSSMEDYLETVYFLEKKHGFARVSDIASRIGVKKPSVNTALKNLAGKGLLEHEKYGSVSLTKQGRDLAGELQGKEDILFRFLTEYLFIEPGTAREEACRLEHSVGKITLSRLTSFFAFIESVLAGKSSPDGPRSLELHMKRGRKQFR